MKLTRTILTLALAILIALAVFPTVAIAEGSEIPYLSLTNIPVYGDKNGIVKGSVFYESRAKLDYRNYRVTLYLQVSENGAYWVKPTFAQPYVNIKSGGTFSINSNTGGEDRNAVKFHILLLPASYTPGSSFEDARANSLDCLTVTRSVYGTVTVEPRTNGRAEPTVRSNAKVVVHNRKASLSVNKSKIAVNAALYTGGISPERNDALSVESVTAQMKAIRKFANTVRFFASSGEVNKAYAIAKKNRLSIIGTAWIGRDEQANLSELDALIALANKGYLRLVVVGSEAIQRGDQTAEQIMEKIDYVRSRLKRKLPVTTAETHYVLMSNPQLREQCDVMFVNYYPYWSGVDIELAICDFAARMKELKAAEPKKQLIVSETGWPTAGGTVGSAVPSEENAARYFNSVRAWSLKTKTNVIYFDAADESWKASSEGSVGAHWGILNEDLTMKEGYRTVSIFRKYK